MKVTPPSDRGQITRCRAHPPLYSKTVVLGSRTTELLLLRVKTSTSLLTVMPEERCSRSGLGTWVTWKVIFHILSIVVADYRVTVTEAGITVANSSIWDPGNFTVLITSITKMSSSAPESGAWHIFFFYLGVGFLEDHTLAHLTGW